MMQGRFVPVAALLMALAFWPACARATEQQLRFEPDGHVQCLQRGSAAVPSARALRAEAGMRHLRYLLRFEAADKPPVIELLAGRIEGGTPALFEAYLSEYRLPCLDATEGPFELLQEFLIPAKDGQVESAAVVDVIGPSMQRACIDLVPPEQFQYPKSMSMNALTVVFGLRFPVGGVTEPAVEVLYQSLGRSLARELASYYGGSKACQRGTVRHGRYLLPHMYTQGERRNDAPRFKDGSLFDLLAVAKSQQLKAYFDTTAMGCPFQLEWMLLQPAGSNHVSELGEHDAGRAGLMAYLRGLELDLSPVARQQLTGQSMKLTVPCGELNLQPQGQ